MTKKNFFKFLFLILSVIFTNSAKPSDDILDGVVAVVNGEIILASDLQYEEKKEAIQSNLSSQKINSKNLAKNVLLDRMINELILIQRAKNLQIYIEPRVIENVIKNIANRGGINSKQLKKEIENQGLSFYRFRRGVEKELIFTRLREIEVENQLRISENEVDLFLEFHANNNLSAEEVLVSQYKVSFQNDASKKDKIYLHESLQQKLILLKKQFKNGIVASDQNLENFSSMGWRSYDRLPNLFVKRIQALKSGEFSEIIESPSGFHILYLQDRRSSVLKKEVPIFKVRHILLKVDSPKNENKIRRRALELRNQIIAGGSFYDLAINYSADARSAEKGGELGWAYPGDYVPEFERAILELKVGQISNPVRSIFGFHVIELIDRKKALLSKERQRTMAKLILKENKLKESTDEWVRELRANSYVEIKSTKSRL